MGISAQTLYKWKNEVKETPTPTADKKRVATQDLLKADDDYLREKIAQLENENAKLRSLNGNLKKALQAFIE